MAVSCVPGHVADVVGRLFLGKFVEVPCWTFAVRPSRSPGNETLPMLPLVSRLHEDLVWFCVTSILLQDWNVRGVRNRFNTTVVPGIMIICVPRSQTMFATFPVLTVGCWVGPPVVAMRQLTVRVYFRAI